VTNPFADEILGILCEAECAHKPVNLVDLIAGTCGWLPLTPGESMIVTFDDHKYAITRHPDPVAPTEETACHAPPCENTPSSS
jgi:hypothetical protein